MPQPEVIFLDAVGTLFGVRGSVGEIYSDFARQVGVEVETTALDRAFRHSFFTAPRAAFPGVAPQEIPALEFGWWRAIAAESFGRVGVLEQFTDFDSFFKLLFAHFATAAPWEVYEDVPEALAQWQSQGQQLGVLSNFDSRLHPVLNVLNLAQFFSTVTISTTVGAAKPEAEIFTAALAKYGCAPETTWHIGDSWGEDVAGAIAAGIKPIWLNRHAQPCPDSALRVTTALKLTDLVSSEPI